MLTNRHIAVVIIMCLAVLPAGQLAAGQTAVPPPERLAVLRDKSQGLTTDEQAEVAAWIADRLDTLHKNATKPVGAGYTTSDKDRNIVKARDALVRASQGGQAYRQAYLAAVASAVPPRLVKPDYPALLKLNLAIVLAQLADPALLDTYLAVLDNTDPMVKYWTLKGLEVVREKLTEPQLQQVCPAVNDLVRAARGNAILLDQAARVVDSSASPPCRSAVVGQLTMRAAALAQGDFPAVGARQLFADIAVRAYRRATETERAEILQSLAAALTAAANHYLTCEAVTTRYRTDVHLFVYDVESTLARLTDRDGSLPVTTVLGGGDRRAVDAALVGWCGSATTKGVLNNPPYNLKLPAAATTPAAGE